MAIIVMDNLVQVMESAPLDHVYLGFVQCVMMLLLDIIVMVLIVLVIKPVHQGLVLTQHVFLVTMEH